MWSEKQIKMMRCGKGLFTAKDMVDALAKEGVDIATSTYLGKEKGKRPFSAKEIRALSAVLGLTIGQAVDIFS